MAAKKKHLFTEAEYHKIFRQEREGGIPKATIEKLKQQTQAEKQRETRIRRKWLASQARAGTGPFAKKKTTAKKVASGAGAAAKKVAKKAATRKKAANKKFYQTGSTNITMDDVRAYRAKMKKKKASA